MMQRMQVSKFKGQFSTLHMGQKSLTYVTFQIDFDFDVLSCLNYLTIVKTKIIYTWVP
jgi:hypothetical protein